MEEDEKEKGLQSLINKINHPLSEVRGRSLRNILFKLQNNLISVADLVCNKFLRHLLEWFNYPECSHESHVLELIDKLITQNENAAQMLLELGGVEFLSQLRLHSHESLHGLIDTILDHTLNLREMSTIQLGTMTNNQPSNNLSDDIIPVTTVPFTSPVNMTLSAQSFVTETTTLSGVSLRSITQLQDCETQTSQPLLLDDRFTHGAGEHGGATHEGGATKQEFVITDPPPVSFHCNGLILPWIILSHNDQHILLTTDGRLQNSDESLVVSSCEFICEVLLQDFPPELFLQRPLIVKSLVKLVSGNGNIKIACKALECLCELTAGLQCRLAMLHDPSMAHTDPVTSFVTYLAASSAQQHPNPSNEELTSLLSDLEDINNDKMEQLKTNQLRIDQYCHLIVDHCITVLLDLLNKEELTDNCGDGDVTGLLCGVLRLLHNTVQLLGKVFLYQKMDDTSELRDSVQVTLKQSLGGIAEVLVQCMSKWKRKLQSVKQNASCQGMGSGRGHLLSTTCTVLIHTAWCFSGTLRLQVDVNNCVDSLPDNCIVIIRDVVLNGFFSVCFPRIVSTLLPYLKCTDKRGYDAYHQAEEMRKAFTKASIFLNLSVDVSVIQKLKAATECLPSLLFPLSDRNMIIEKCMKLCLTSGDNSVVPLLLQLLSYPCDEVKILAYTHLEQFLTSKDTVGELSKFITLLIDFDVLEELVCFGLDNKVAKITKSSQCIITHLIRIAIQPSNADCSITDKLLTKLATFLPYLETGLCNEESNEEMLKSFILHDSKVGLAQNQKILCALRLMLSAVSALRVWGLSVLSKQLVIDRVSNKKSPFSSVSDTLLHDVLVCATPPNGEHKVGTQCALNRKDVGRLTQLLASKSLDTPLKKSSLQQLYIVLQDYTLHDAAIEAGAVDHLLLILSSQLKYNKNDTSNATSDDLPLLSSCVGCLRLLAHTSSSLRSCLAGDSVFLMDTLRGVLLLQADKVLRYNTSKLLFYILYHDVAVFTHPAVGSGAAIPHQILAKLRLPYDVTPAHPVSKRAITPVMSAALLNDQSISSMLRIYRQISACSSVFDLIHLAQNNNTVTLLSASELVVLGHMDQVSVVWTSILQLENASTHQEMTKCLDQVNIALTGLSSELPSGAVEKLKQIVGRFLTTAPTSSNDCDLFCHVLSFCLHAFILTTPPKVTNEMDKNSFNTWLCELTATENCTCLQLLSSTPEASSIEELDIIRVQKAVMKFYSNLLARAPMCLFKGPFCVQLMDTLCCRLNMAGSPSYYDLPFLEISLRCLLHLTSLPLNSVSSQVMELYMKLAVSLRQVLWSFISGRGEAFASFMGKGVTLQASMSLCHLIHAVTLLERGEKLSIEWVASSLPDVGLSWIHSLVQDRAAQVRYAGYTLMGVLCTHQMGTEAMLTECKSVMPAGLWSLCMQTLLNNQECGMVRGKAGEVLLQLLKYCQGYGRWENFITFSTQEVTLLGLEALHALIQHSNIVAFLQETLTSLFTDSPIFNSVNDGDSNIFNDHHGIGQLTAMIAPYFISAMCRILHNLVILLSDSLLSSVHHDGVDTLFLRFLDNKLLLYVLKSSVHSQSLVLLSSWVLMLADVVTLLCTLVQYGPQLFLPTVVKEKHVNSLFKLLTIANEYSNDQMVYRELLPLCKEVVLLLYTSGKLLANSCCGENFFTAAHSHWNTITVMTKRSLMDEMEDLSTANLGLLNLVLSQWFKPSSDCSGPVDAAYRKARLLSLEKKMENSETTCASDLCTVILSSYDGNVLHCSGHKNCTRKCLISHTLAVLLASSDSAKATALKAGLMESSVEVLRNLHTKLCMESLDGGKKKTSPLVSEAIQAVQLVGNFMYHSELVKLAAIQCQLSAAVHKLWPWCIIDQPLLASVLLMLGTFTAHCAKACLSLCSLTCGSTSLMQSIMKQATRTVSSYQTPLASRKQHSRHSTVLSAVFSLLANTTVSTECRGLMRKFSFLDLFSTLRPKAESAIPGRCLLFSCWLQLLVNLTMYNDGQQMVLKQPDALELIVELWQFSNDKGVRLQATLLTRNLCFYGPTKTLLASNENFLALLQSGLRSQEVDDVAMVSSAVWALLSGCRKVRASLKKSPLPELLRHSFTTLQDSGVDNHKRCLHHVSQAMKILE